MAESLEEQARREVYELGVIVDRFDGRPVPLVDLAAACDRLGVSRPFTLTRAIAEPN
jgi:hypothetical protein